MYLDFFNNDLFHFKHIMILVVCLIAIIAFTIFAVKKLSVDQFHKVLLIVGIVSETLKVFTYIVMNEGEFNGYLPKTDLPFHLCSIQLIFICILNFGKNDNVKHLLHSFMIPTCLVGGVAALILATSSSRNNTIIGIQYFMYHSAIISFAIYLLAKKDIVFTAKDYVNVCIMLFATFFVAIYLNSMLYYKKDNGDFANINFMYVVNPPESGLPFLNKNHGWLVYIVHYASLAYFVVTLTFIKPIIEFFKNRKEKGLN